MNYNQYPPLGVDKKMLIMQNAMSSNLGFTNVNYFGRAHKIVSSDGKSFTAQVFVSNTERKEVYYDDANAPGGSVFFIEADDHTTKDGVLFTAKVKIVFMLNLNKLIGEKAYRADSEVQDQCMKLVKRIGSIDVTGFQKGLKNIMEGFNIDSIKMLDTQPYHTFSINGNLSYNFNCKN